MKHTHLGLMLAATVVLGAACGSSDDSTSTTTSTSTGGEVTCTPTDPTCPALSVTSDCLGLVDNAGKDQFAMRLSQLEVTAPKALTSPTVQKVVGDGVYVNLPECNVAGLGTFSLVVEFDLKGGKLKAGGAAPAMNPEEGYCYVNDSTNGVAPIEVKTTFDGLKFSTEAIPKVVLPVYVDASAKSAVFLPLTGAKLEDGTISADHNCIGSLNDAPPSQGGLDPLNNCLPEPGVGYFKNDATLTGYITLEEADAVNVDLLGQSLCVLLSGDAAKYGDTGSPKKCKRTGGKLDLEGDWCSTSNMAGDCKDSFRLEAKLAASSVKVRTDCN
jgi:hypothetical protein